MRAPLPRRILATTDTIYFFAATADESSDRTRRAMAYAVGSRTWMELRIATPDGAAKPSTDPRGVRLADSSTFVMRGGVLRYETPDGRSIALKHEGLVDHTVSALAYTAEALWIGTDRTDGSAYGGLLRFRPADSSWARFVSGASPLPGNDILALQATNEVLAIATDSGMAVLEPRTGAWQVRYFQQVARNDSVVWIASVSRPTEDPMLVAARRLGTLLGDTRLSALHDACLLGNRDPLLLIARMPESEVKMRGVLDIAAAALSDPAFLPFLERAIDSDDSAQRLLASEALVRSSDPRARALLNRLMATGSIDRALYAVGRLALSRRDSAATRWLAAKLADPAVRSDTVRRALGGAMPMSRLDTLVETVIALGEPSFAPALWALLDGPTSHRVIPALMDLGTLPQQKELIGVVAARPKLWAAYFAQFVPDDSGSTPRGGPFGEDRDLRRTLVTLARLALMRPDSALEASGLSEASARRTTRTNAVGVLVEWGGSPVIPFLIEQLGRPNIDALALVEGIVRVAGVDGGPVFKSADATPEQRRATQMYWNRWWAANSGSFAAPTRDGGTRAVRAWRTRAGVE